jgi:hypothetical protein
MNKEMSQSAERLFLSQKELCSMELFRISLQQFVASYTVNENVARFEGDASKAVTSKLQGH